MDNLPDNLRGCHQDNRLDNRLVSLQGSQQDNLQDSPQDNLLPSQAANHLDNRVENLQGNLQPISRLVLLHLILLYNLLPLPLHSSSLI